jgi:hypothetical protein
MLAQKRIRKSTVAFSRTLTEVRNNFGPGEAASPTAAVSRTTASRKATRRPRIAAKTLTLRHADVQTPTT